MRPVTEFKSAVVAIVRFLPSQMNPDFPKAGKFYAVSITPENPQQLSPSGDYIRFGDVAGDELLGWQRVADLDVVDVIAWYERGERIQYQRGDVEVIAIGQAA